MKGAVNIAASFLLGSAQFIIGVFLIVGKANIKTIGWYYIVASCFTVTVSIIAAVAAAAKGGN